MRSPLDEFLAGEVSAVVRSELLAAIEQLGGGWRYFTYNAFNVLLDGGASTATIEDELDISRQDSLGLDEFRALPSASVAFDRPEQ